MDELIKERDLLVKRIAGISEELKGPMSNIERAWLVEDRKEMRARLAEIERAVPAMRVEAGR